MVDARDLEIVELLEEDGRAPFVEIARRLGLSESTVRKRVLALQEEGVIRGFSVSVDPAKVGLNTVAIVGIDVEPISLEEVAQGICKLPESKYVAISTGDHMIMTEIRTKDGRALTRLLSGQIGTMEGVRKICPSIVLEKLKG